MHAPNLYTNDIYKGLHTVYILLHYGTGINMHLRLQYVIFRNIINLVLCLSIFQMFPTCLIDATSTKEILYMQQNSTGLYAATHINKYVTECSQNITHFNYSHINKHMWLIAFPSCIMINSKLHKSPFCLAKILWSITIDKVWMFI